MVSKMGEILGKNVLSPQSLNFKRAHRRGVRKTRREKLRKRQESPTEKGLRQEARQLDERVKGL